MAGLHGPRIGRADRLAALHAQRAAEDALGLPVGMPAATRLLIGLPAAAPAPEPQWEAVRESAARLAEQLRPLPAALSEIATRINRHCANTGRDAELARVVEAVRGRTFDLWRAVYDLANAAGKEGARDGGRENGR
jgi:hypothetical protein